MAACCFRAVNVNESRLPVLFYVRPALLVLDEATSALDPTNEAAIRSAIAKIQGNLTIVLIGHRLAFLDQADQVIELQNGKIVRSGLPVELGS